MNRIVILVHGTFAPHAAWTLEDSPLRKALSRSLPATHFLTFPWSGKNSHQARLEAGESLANLILTSTQRHPGVKHYVIAHSHGGNVALYACRSSEVCSRLAGIVTVATPFISARPRRIPAYLSTILFQLFIPLYFIVIGAGFVVSEVLFAWANSLSESTAIPAAFALLLACTSLLFALGSILLGLWICYDVFSRPYRRVRRWIARVQNELVTRYAPLPSRPVEILNLQITFDEARWFLRASRRLGQMIIQAHIPFVWLACWTTQLLFVANVFGPTPSEDAKVLAMAIGPPVASVAMTLAVIVTGAIAFSIRNARAGFGESSLEDALFVDVGVQPMPPTAVRLQDLAELRRASVRMPLSIRSAFGLLALLPSPLSLPNPRPNVTTLRLARPPRVWGRVWSLRHSILYASEDVCNAIAGWLLLRESRRDTEPASLERAQRDAVVMGTLLGTLSIEQFTQSGLPAPTAEEVLAWQRDFASRASPILRAAGMFDVH